MSTKLTVTTKIVVNGKEYHGVDELPAELRGMYDKAVAAGTRTVQKTRIVFNGHTYETLEAVPAEARRLYEAAIATVPALHASESIAPPGTGPITESDDATQRFVMALFGVAVLAGLLYWIYAR